MGEREGGGREKHDLGVVVYTCNPSTPEAKVGGFQVLGQPELHDPAWREVGIGW